MLPINKTLEDVRSTLFARIESVQDEYQQKGWLPQRMNLNKGVIRGLLEIYAWGIWQLYAFMQENLPQAFPKESTGAWLDMHSHQVEISRKPATKAKGLVFFKRDEAGGNLPIPAGRIVRTLPDGLGRVFRYVTTKDVVLPDGSLEVAIPVEAEDYGQAANATPGQICEIITHIEGVNHVENCESWLTSEGTDEETDQELGERYVLRWKGNNSSNKYAYAFWATSVTGVASVHIVDDHPRGQGTIDIIVQGTAGIPTQDLLDRVKEAVNTCARPEDEFSSPPINDDWKVFAPIAVDVAIEAELVLLPGAHASSVLAEAENNTRALFAGENSFKIGEDVTKDRLTATVMAVDGVKKVNWARPGADVTVPANGLAILESLALTSIEAEEI